MVFLPVFVFIFVIFFGSIYLLNEEKGKSIISNYMNRWIDYLKE